MQQIAFRSDDADLAVRHLDALGERAEMVAAVAAAGEPNALAGRGGELPHHGGGDALLAVAFERGGRSFGFGLRPFAGRFEAGDAVLERRVVQIGDAAFDGVIKTPEPQIGFRGSPVQLGDMFAAAIGAFLAAVENRRQHFLKPLWLKQPVFDVADNKVVQLLHRDRAALAAGLALTRFDRAGVVAIASALAGPERHGAAAVRTEADAGREGGTADDARRRDLRISGAEMDLHSVEGRLIDQRRAFGRYDLAGRLLAALGAGAVELVATDIGRPRQHFMELPDPPPAAVAGEDATRIQVADDRLHTHRAGCAVALQRQAVDQPHRFGVQRVDFEPLLNLRSALLGRDDAIADRRAGAVPEALPGILLHGPERVLAVLLGLVLVE